MLYLISATMHNNNMKNITISEQYLDLSQGKIFVRQWRPDNSAHHDPIVLLHDSLGSVDLWRDLPQQLAALLNRPVIAYDRLGFGKSSARTELPSVRFVAEEAELYFPQVCQALNITRFYLFGHSVGGGMALLIAANNAHCKGVISVATQAFVEERTKEGIRVAQKAFQDPMQLERLKKWHGEKAQWVLSAWTDVWLSEDFSDWNLIQEIKHITCPALVIHGEDDEYGSRAFPETIRDNVSGPVQMEVLSNCAHMPHKEQTEQVLALIEAFFA